MRKTACTVTLCLIALCGNLALADKGRLNIDSDPRGGQVYINGKLEGVIPSQSDTYLSVEVDEGEHQVEVKLTRSDLNYYATKAVSVKQNTTTSLKIILQQITDIKSIANRSNDELDNLIRLEKNMQLIPGGHFTMGSPSSEVDREEYEGPQHQRKITAFYLSIYEVTNRLWQQCIEEKGCPKKRKSDDWIGDDLPVIFVSWIDVQRFLRWIGEKTGKPYRLPSEAEWEYAARGGSNTVFSFGDDIKPSDANYDARFDYNQGEYGEYLGKTAPVGSYKPNQFGLYDMHGNVYEWTADCWNEGYLNAPATGEAWLRGDCRRRVLRGGSWYSVPRDVRVASRRVSSSKSRYIDHGFRLALSK